RVGLWTAAVGELWEQLGLTSRGSLMGPNACLGAAGGAPTLRSRYDQEIETAGDVQNDTGLSHRPTDRTAATRRWTLLWLRSHRRAVDRDRLIRAGGGVSSAHVTARAAGPCLADRKQSSGQHRIDDL